MFRIALCQIAGSPDKELNREKAGKYVREAAEAGAQIVCLPEMWSCPYSSDCFRDYAEPADGESVRFMAGLARELGIYLIGGTVSELDDSDVSEDGNPRVYNTTFCFDRQGNLIGRHRKVHLFDIDVPGKVRFMESDTLSAGNEMTILDTEYGKIGVAICYDVRFPEWFMKMALEGAGLVFLPAAFTNTTGAAHWDIIIRARAIDNQLYFAANAPARDENGVFKAYGHSCIIDPWGQFIAHADEKECIIYGNIDLDYEEDIRNQLPLLKHRRPELY